MLTKRVTVGMQNLLGNVLLGFGFITMGVVDLIAGINNPLMGALVLLLALFLVVSFYTLIPGHSEPDDEMSSRRMFLAGWVSNELCAIALLVVYSISFCKDINIDARALVCLVAGSLMLVRGIAYAVLARRDADGFDD